MDELEKSRKAVGTAVANVDEMTQRFERRINEISEIQRLNDERFRQEWTGFKTDDLKRWTNYILGQEEASREINQQLEETHRQLQELSDMTQITHDKLERLTKETVKHVQGVLMAYQESIQAVAPLLDKKG